MRFPPSSFPRHPRPHARPRQVCLVRGRLVAHQWPGIRTPPPPRAVPRRTQFTLHANRQTPLGASRSVQVMSAWSVKTRHAPSRHCRGVMVYGHTATAMHDIEYPPPLATTAAAITATGLLSRYVPLKYAAVIYQVYIYMNT